MDKNQHNRKRGLDTTDDVANTSDTFEWYVPKIGWRQTCHFYEPDDCDKDNTMVFELSFAYARSTLDEKESACYFGSALCAFCPDLTPVVIAALEDYGIEPIEISLPSEAGKFGVNLEINTSKYDSFEIYTIVGSCLTALFINNVNVITDEFMRNMIYALAKKLRMPADKILDFGEETLLDQAKAIYNVLGNHDSLREDVEKLLMWLSKRKDKMASMASFVLEWKYKFA